MADPKAYSSLFDDDDFEEEDRELDAELQVRCQHLIWKDASLDHIG